MQDSKRGAIRLSREDYRWMRDAAMEARRFEIQNFWTRAAYFWAFQIFAGAIVVALLENGTEPLENSEPAKVIFAWIGVWLGTAASISLYIGSRGAKYGQEVWEKRLEMLEPAPLFRSVTYVEAGFLGAGSGSVTKVVILFCVITTILWFLAGIALMLYHVDPATVNAWLTYFPPLALGLQILIVLIVFFTTESDFMRRSSAYNRGRGCLLPRLKRCEHDSPHTPRSGDDHWPEFCVATSDLESDSDVAD